MGTRAFLVGNAQEISKNFPRYRYSLEYLNLSQNLGYLTATSIGNLVLNLSSLFSIEILWELAFFSVGNSHKNFSRFSQIQHRL